MSGGQRPRLTEDQRFYIIDGVKDPLPRVSTILAMIHSQGLEDWQRDKGWEEADRIGREAADYGTLLHAACEAINYDIPLGTRDPEAEFLQGLAFATLALFFTQNRNQEGALLMVDDALIALGKYRPRFMGVQIDPIIGTLQTLRPLIASLPADGENPMFPFVYAKFEHDGALPT